MKQITLAALLIILPLAALILMSMLGNALQQLAAMVLVYGIIGIVGIALAGLVLWLLLHKPGS
jgi:hypothetical protein